MFELVDEAWVERGRTEVVVNSNDPDFVKTVEVNYFFEQDQTFRLIVSDSDQLGKDFVSLQNSNYIGEVVLKIQNLVSNVKK